MIVRAPQLRIILLGFAVVAGVIFLFTMQPGAALSSSPKVIYVDLTTGKVIDNIEAAAAAAAADTANQAEAAPQKQEHAGGLRPPIKDEQKEEAAAKQQLESQQHAGSKAGDCVILGQRAKATFVTLARNSELYELVKAIRNVEDRFNRKFHYDWVFLNDEDFTQEFKDVTSSIVSGTAKYGRVPVEHWSYPDFIDQERAAKVREEMKKAKIIYGDLESYRHMCRFESGFFYRHELMQPYDWYWRVEPGIQIHCDLDYDLFRYMEEHNKEYGFTISIHEFEKTIPTLWQHTKDFIKLHPEYVADNNFMDFVSDDGGNTYNLCHFWSNFEIASLKFFRGKAYSDYFDYLDKQGGFFYERWGDAPVHSIAVALFMNKDKIHYFHDVGYNHGVYTQCPLNREFRMEHGCTCKPSSDFTFRGYSCGKKYFEKMNLEKPKEWVDYQ